MHRTYTKLFMGIALGLAAAALAPVASAGSSPRQTVTIPESLARIQYPGTSSKPTVYLDPFGGRDSKPTTVYGPDGPVTIPAWLARIQYPGTSSKPTVYVNPKFTVPAWLARIQYPGTSSEPTVLIPRVSHTPTAAADALDARAGGGFDWGSFGIGIAAATGVALIGVGGLLAMRRRRPLAHV